MSTSKMCNDWCGPGSHHMTPCPAAPSEPPAEVHTPGVVVRQDQHRNWCMTHDQPWGHAARPSADVEDAAELILIEHQRRDIKGCSCGEWGSDHGHMGQSHAVHVIERLRAAGISLTLALDAR